MHSLFPRDISDAAVAAYTALCADWPDAPTDEAIELHRADWQDLQAYRHALRGIRSELVERGEALSASERDALGVASRLLQLVNGELDMRTDAGSRDPRPTAGRRQTPPDSGDNPRRPLSASTGSVQRGGASGSLGSRIAAAFRPHAEMFRHSGSVAFDIRAAATDPITTTEVGTTINFPAKAPSSAVIGAQNVIPSRSVPSATIYSYPRYSGVTGAAAEQAAEGEAKAAVKAGFTLITEAAVTIAGYSKMSVQAMADAGELESVADGVLRRSIGLAVDDALIDGAGGFTGFEALAGAVTSLVYSGVADAASEEVAAMQAAGFNPTVAILNPATWLTVVTAKGTANDHYLSGDYLGELPMTMRGLRVGLSPNLAAGKVLLLDIAFCEYLISDQIRVTLGLDGNDFTKNLVTMRAETRITPVYRAVGAARLVTPKA